MSSNPIVQLHGETLALQIVVQRLIGQMALSSKHDPQIVLRAEHGQASAELAQSDVSSDPPGDEDAIRAHAQNLLDDIYLNAAKSQKGGP